MKKVEFDISKYSNHDIKAALAIILTIKAKGKSIFGFKVNDKQYSAWDITIPNSFDLSKSDDTKLVDNINNALQKQFLAKQKDMISKCNIIIRKADKVIFDNKRYIAIMANSTNAEYCQVYQEVSDLYSKLITSNAHYNYKYSQRNRELNNISCS